MEEKDGAGNGSRPSIPGRWLDNGTGEGPPPLLTDAWLVPLFYALVMALGLLGNALLLFVLSRRRGTRTATHCYLANLAVTDVVFLLCCVPFTATLYPLPGWVFGEFMCKFVNYVQQVTVQATCLTLTAMSVDRCYATLFPLRSLRHRTAHGAMAVSTAIWLGSLALAVPAALPPRLELGYWYGLRIYCTEVFPSLSGARALGVYTFLVAYLLPLATIGLCAACVLHRLRRPAVGPLEAGHQAPPGPRPSRARVSRMVVAVVVVFAVCWGPIQLFLLLQGLTPSARPSYTTYKFKTWANCMSYANSALNPLVYAFLGHNFRKSFHKAIPLLSRPPAPEALPATRDLVPLA
ncbi:G-protein coupled receptor 54-like [Tachyglossus aculeatus]|uniref:G-protein coupled receptor 54-like n=1 Tax=Tachyglossus aculeatus TaxID=9261 RepID=UPI0018F66CD6|nr:G-protein coupled receptor 54-like [Tachyglossus aculeatus]